MPAFDLIIRGGTIVDGTGAERFTGDVAVKDGLIAQVGEVRGDAERDGPGPGAPLGNDDRFSFMLWIMISTGKRWLVRQPTCCTALYQVADTTTYILRVSSYQGEFLDGVAHGKGVETATDGKVRSGIWENGRPQKEDS